mmetsp:Transcript_18794/g.43182  ORF Transcript_18794/g.43182 Transcript_18794/m.43182 type:complete len:227 (+) Transcript_18794:916-1596(+)
MAVLEEQRRRIRYWGQSSWWVQLWLAFFHNPCKLRWYRNRAGLQLQNTDWKRLLTSAHGNQETPSCWSSLTLSGSYPTSLSASSDQNARSSHPQRPLHLFSTSALFSFTSLIPLTSAASRTANVVSGMIPVSRPSSSEHALLRIVNRPVPFFKPRETLFHSWSSWSGSWVASTMPSSLPLSALPTGMALTKTSSSFPSSTLCKHISSGIQPHSACRSSQLLQLRNS